MTRSLLPSRHVPDTPRRYDDPSVSDFRPDQTGELLRTTVAMAVLGVVIPFLVVDWGRNDTTTLNQALGMAVVLISAARLSVAFGTGRPDLLRTFFYLFVYVFLGLAATAQAVSGAYPMDARSYPDDVVTRGLVVILVGVLAYEVGWYAWNWRAGSAPPRPATAPRRRWYVAQYRVVLLGLFAIAATAYQVGTNGLSSFFLSRSETTGLLTGAEYGNRFYEQSDKVVGLLTAFITQVPLFVALFLYLYCRHHRLWPTPRNLVTDALGKSFAGLLIVGNLIINNPIGNARFWFLLIAVSIVSIYLRYSRPFAVRTYLVLALAILLLVFTALDAFRNTDKTDFTVSGPGTSLVSDETYAMFQMELNGVEYIDSQGYTYGHQLLGSALTFVPRSIWESKPIATGQLVDPKYARAATLWTELQVDFGLLGVVAGFLLVGAASAAASRRAVTATPGVLHALVPVFAVFQIFLLRGSLLPAVGHLYQLLLVLAMMIGFARLAPGGPVDDPVPREQAGRTRS